MNLLGVLAKHLEKHVKSPWSFQETTAILLIRKCNPEKPKLDVDDITLMLDDDVVVVGYSHRTNLKGATVDFATTNYGPLAQHLQRKFDLTDPNSIDAITTMVTRIMSYKDTLNG